MMSNPKDKFGSAKVSFTRIPTTAMVEMAKAGMYGNHMYKPFNWREEDKQIRLSVYLDAILRHVYRLFDGEDVDPDSLVSHWGHIAQGAAIAIDAISLGNYIDDRPIKGVGAKAIDDFSNISHSYKQHWEEVKQKKEKDMQKIGVSVNEPKSHEQ